MNSNWNWGTVSKINVWWKLEQIWKVSVGTETLFFKLFKIKKKQQTLSNYNHFLPCKFNGGTTVFDTTDLEGVVPSSNDDAVEP